MIYDSFIIPLLMILTGYLMYKYPPKRINHIVGYRTYKSMRNKEMWDYANKYCGKLWMILGLIMSVLTFVLLFLVLLEVIIFTENILITVIVIQVVMLLLTIFIVENRLKRYLGE